MDFKLTEEQRSIVRTVRELTQDKFKPNALKYMDGSFPWDNLRDLAQIGDGMAVGKAAACEEAHADARRNIKGIPGRQAKNIILLVPTLSDRGLHFYFMRANPATTDRDRPRAFA